MLKNLFYLLSLLATASAHGYIPSISIAGKQYKANDVGESGTPSVLRAVSSQDPMYGADHADLSCGPGSKPAELSAEAKAGDEVQVEWMDAADGNWPHNTGPMQTYLSKCDADCKDTDSSKAKWFKIDEQGIRKDGSWAQASLHAGHSAKVTLPPTLAPGNYLLRHEIIALHIAEDLRKAEFYANCAQISISGSGSGVPPDDSKLVTFPGAYSDKDPGIFVGDVYSMKEGDYKFPGPEIVNLVSSSDDSSSSGSSSSSTTDSSPSTANSASTPTQTSSSPSSSPSDTSTPSSSSSAGVSNHLSQCTLRSQNTLQQQDVLQKRGFSEGKRVEKGPVYYNWIMRGVMASLHL